MRCGAGTMQEEKTAARLTAGRPWLEWQGDVPLMTRRSPPDTTENYDNVQATMSNALSAILLTHRGEQP